VGWITRRGWGRPGIESLCFQKPGIRPKGSGQADVRRGVKGGDNGVEAERELLNLLGKEGP